MALELTNVLRIPRGVVVNRDDPNIDQSELENLCKEKNAPILLRIPFRREYAEQYAIGNLLIDQDSELKSQMVDLLDEIKCMIKKGDENQ